MKKSDIEIGGVYRLKVGKNTTEVRIDAEDYENGGWVPASLLMTSMQVNETTTANKPKPANNPHVGKFEVVSSTYLSNTSFTGASSKAWYLLADPNRLPSIEVAFLNGVDRPTVERTDADFNTLGVQFRGYIDFGVREQDFRGALKMKGEA